MIKLNLPNIQILFYPLWSPQDGGVNIVYSFSALAFIKNPTMIYKDRTRGQ